MAILAVLACHLVLVTPWGRASMVESGFGGSVGFAKVLENGLLGVNLFFVLSGFVLFRPYACGGRRMQSRSDAIHFYRRRIARLYPLYLLGVLIPLGMRYPFADFLDLLKCLGLLLTGTFVFSSEYHVPRFNTPLWSLGPELWFSVLFPLLVIARRRWNWTRVLATVAAASLAARWWAPAPVSAWLGETEALGPIPTGARLFAALVIGRLDDFVLGAFLAEVHERGLLSGAVTLRWPLLATAVGMFLAVVPWRHGAWPWATPWTPLQNTLVQAGVTALVVATLEWPAGLGQRLLWSPGLRYAGVMCYSLYIWHAPVMNAFLVRTVSWDRLGMWALLTLGISLATAAFVERVIPPRRATN
jgi:peptidoglycan/LPS O-acetylase OafA/YrhL